MLGLVGRQCCVRLHGPLRWIHWKVTNSLYSAEEIKAHANGRNIVGQQVPTLLGPTCCVRLHSMLALVASCWHLLDVVGWCLKLVKHLAQQVPTFLLFCGHRSEAQHCWVRLHRIPNNVGYDVDFISFVSIEISNAECSASPTKRDRQPTMSGVVAPVWTEPTTHANNSQQLPTLLGRQCWELLRPFAWALIVCFEVQFINSFDNRITEPCRSHSNWWLLGIFFLFCYLMHVQ